MIRNTAIRAIIVEDHDEARDYLIRLLNNNFDNISILGHSDNIEDAVSLIDQLQPELIFMDIELTDGLSFEIFKRVSYHNFEVIFITAFQEFTMKALEHYAFSYLTKPLDVEKLISTINRYISKKERMYDQYKFQLLSSFLQTKEAKIMIHTGNEYVSIKMNQILKCLASGNYTEFYLSNQKKYVASKNLKYYENLLTEKGFFKANRSAMINVDFIASIYKKETIILNDGDKIRVSVRNKSNLSDLIDSLS